MNKKENKANNSPNEDLTPKLGIKSDKEEIKDEAIRTSKNKKKIPRDMPADEQMLESFDDIRKSQNITD